MTEAAQDIDDGVESEIHSSNNDPFTFASLLYTENNQSNCDDHSKSEFNSDIVEVTRADSCDTNQNDTDLVTESFDNHFVDDISFDKSQLESWRRLYDCFCKDSNKSQADSKHLEDYNNTNLLRVSHESSQCDPVEQPKIELPNPLRELKIDDTSSPSNSINQSSTSDQNFLDRIPHLSSIYLSENISDSEMICYRATLQVSLDKKFRSYENVMQRWLEGDLDRESYERHIHECVPQDALKYHNKLILTLLEKSFNLASPHIDRQHYIDQIDLKDLFVEFEKGRTEPTSKNVNTPVALASSLPAPTKDESQDDDDDDNIVLINKSKKRKRKRFQILDDDEDEDEANSSHGTNSDVARRSSINNEVLNHTKKKKRKMVITSDDENDANSPCTSLLFDTESSNSNANFEDEPKVINVKSTGMLKTTLTISRKNASDSLSKSSSSSNVKNSFLNKLLSSDTPISLLPNSAATSSDASISSQASQQSPSSLDKSDKKMIRIQNSTLLNSVSNANLKPQNDNSKTNSNKKIVTTLNPSNLRINQTITKPPTKPGQTSSSSLIQGGSTKKQKSTLLNNSMKQSVGSSVANSNSNSSDSVTLLDESDSKQAVTTKNQSVNSKLIELLNRKSANAREAHNASHTPSQRTKPSALETLLNPTNGDGGVDSHLRADKVNGAVKETRHERKRSKAKSKQQVVSENHSSSNSNNLDHLSDNSSQQSCLTNGSLLEPIELRLAHNYPKYDNLDDDELSGSIVDFDQGDNSSNEEPITILPITAQESATKCVHELTLPNSDQLSSRIANLALSCGLTSFDSRVLMMCQIGLKNFMKNILSQMAISRSAFQTYDNRLRHHVGTPTSNPYLIASHRSLQMNANKNEFLFARSDSSRPTTFPFYDWHLSLPAHFDSHLKPKKYGVGKNKLDFTEADQASIDTNHDGLVTRFRPNSGVLQICEERPHPTRSTNLYHLYSVLNSNRSLIPVNGVWHRAVQRTIVAFNNVSDTQLDSN